jgi:hypothetical protein
MTTMDYEFRTGGRPEKYPWDRWFRTGRDTVLSREKHFPEAKPTSFRSVAYLAASRRGLRVHIGIEDDLVIIRSEGEK